MVGGEQLWLVVSKGMLPVRYLDWLNPYGSRLLWASTSQRIWVGGTSLP